MVLHGGLLLRGMSCVCVPGGQGPVPVCHTEWGAEKTRQRALWDMTLPVPLNHSAEKGGKERIERGRERERERDERLPWPWTS